MMKRLILLLICFTSLGSVGAQGIVADFQRKYEKETEFSIVNITSKMFQLIGSMTNPEEESIIRDLDGLRVISTDKNVTKYYKDAMSMLVSDGYEELMSVEDGKSNMRMYTQEKKGIITSLVIVSGESAEFSMIGISGKIDLKKIASLSKTLNIEKLDKVKDAKK